jgi:hypothetical protein
MRMTASWFGSSDLPDTRSWRDCIAPGSGLPSIVIPTALNVPSCSRPSKCGLTSVARTKPAREQKTDFQIGKNDDEKKMRHHALIFLTKKIPYKGPGADSEEKHEPASDIDIAVVDSLKVLDLKRPIREADMA